MQVESEDQTTYTRVGPEQVRRFISRPVTIVGKVVGNAAPKRVTLDIGNEYNVLVENIDYDVEHAVPVLEVRGRLTNDRTIKAESWNSFGDNHFDQETFNKMLEHYHSQEYSNMTL